MIVSLDFSVPERQTSENWIANGLNEYLNLRDKFSFELMLWNVSSMGKPELFFFFSSEGQVNYNLSGSGSVLVHARAPIHNTTLYFSSFTKPLVTLHRLCWNQSCWESGPFLLLYLDAGIPLKTCARSTATIQRMQDALTVIVWWQFLGQKKIPQSHLNPLDLQSKLEFWQGERKNPERRESTR